MKDTRIATLAGTLFVIGCFVLLDACTSTSRVAPGDADLVDPEATAETKALYANLKRLAPDYVLFGHQDDLAYGVTWWSEKGRSDVKDVTGAYPAVYGWELGDLEHSAERNLDSVRFDDMKKWIIEGYKRGGVISLSWHMDNPATGGSAWDRSRAVDVILPGGSKHEMYKQWLDAFADFVDDLKTGSFKWLGFGTPVPVIFRPFHEHTGSWFWWGKGNLTPEEYKQLWRFTVEYLRDEKGLQNIIYAYSTDVFDSEEQYLEHYPGDEYVDMLGYDDYHALSRDETVVVMTRRLRMLVEMAEARGKIAALTETGSEGIPVPTWWTERFLKAIASDPVSRRIVYALVWRNANETMNPGHHYAPYPGHTSAADFVAFYNSPFVLFEDELPDLYR